MGNLLSKPDHYNAAAIEAMYAARAVAARANNEHLSKMRKDQSEKEKNAEDTGSNERAPKAEGEETAATAHTSPPRDTSSIKDQDEPAGNSLLSAQTIKNMFNLASSSSTIKVAVAAFHLTDAIRAFGKKAKKRFDDAIRTFGEKAKKRFDNAIRAFGEKAKKRFYNAIEALRMIDYIKVAKEAGRWMKEHPWETAAILVPLILLACTPAFLGLMGFTAGGIAAGSVAAGVQAGIGSVAAGSTFAILTSAAMGGYGVPIVFGGIWVVSTASIGAVAGWKRWKGKEIGAGGDAYDGDNDGADYCIGGGPNGGSGGAEGKLLLKFDRDL